MSVGRGKRFSVLLRDGSTCQYCGRSAPWVRLEVDHVVPRSHGGSDHIDNLVTACFDCNRGKANTWNTRRHFNAREEIAALSADYLDAIRRIAALEQWVADIAGEPAVRAIGREEEA